MANVMKSIFDLKNLTFDINKSWDTKYLSHSFKYSPKI